MRDDFFFILLLITISVVVGALLAVMMDSQFGTGVFVAKAIVNGSVGK